MQQELAESQEAYLEGNQNGQIFHLYGSFAQTYKGHGTDVAIIGGLLDFDTDDERIIKAIDIAKERGMKLRFIEEDAVTDHPNTARVIIGDDKGELELSWDFNWRRQN